MVPSPSRARGGERANLRGNGPSGRSGAGRGPGSGAARAGGEGAGGGVGVVPGRAGKGVVRSRGGHGQPVGKGVGVVMVRGGSRIRQAVPVRSPSAWAPSLP